MWIYTSFILFVLGIRIQCARPELQGDAGNNELDTFITSYISEFKHTLKLLPKKHNINKRSDDAKVDLSKLKGLELLVGVQTIFAVPTVHPSELVLFTQCSSISQDQQVWYAVALEANPSFGHTPYSNSVAVLYKLYEDNWEVRDKKEVDNAVRIAIERIEYAVYVIITQDTASDTDGSTRVFHLNTEHNTLQQIQTLPTHHSAHVVMWKWENKEAFAAVAVSKNPEGSNKLYETYSPVYKWKGDHFDKICSLPSYNPQAIDHFNIDSSLFIVVANYQNELGERRVNSFVYRYDVDKEDCPLYQELPTTAAIDVKFFCIQSSQITERFLIFTSGSSRDSTSDEEGGSGFNVPSVIYKLSDDNYFVPFQALHVSKVTSWLPVRYVQDEQDSLVLLGAAEEGVISYQYDGWRFVPTGVHYDKTVFGPGPKTLSVFYSSDQPFISVANKLSIGGDVNVFSPVFRRDDKIEQIRNEAENMIDNLKTELKELLLKTNDLLHIARSSPSKNDSFIDLGENVIFQHVEIENVETFMTKVGGDDSYLKTVDKKLVTLGSKLQSIQEELHRIHKKIEDTSLDKRTIYQDTLENSAEILCSPSCNVQNLIVQQQLNGENFFNLQKNLVKLEDALEVDGTLSFEYMALNYPLRVETINTHKLESLIDWTKEVVLNQNIKVNGSILINNDVLVGGLFDGISINPSSTVDLNEEDNEVFMSSANSFNSLNVSQLILSDGKVSGTEFERVSSSTLKTEGNQIIQNFNNFNAVFADKVDNVDVWASVAPYLGPGTPPRPEVIAPRSNENEDLIVLPSNSVIYGTLIIENGSVSAKDFVDSKHGDIFKKGLEFDIPFNHNIKNNDSRNSNSSKEFNLDAESVKEFSSGTENESDSAAALKQEAPMSKSQPAENNLKPQTRPDNVLDSFKIASLTCNSILLDGKSWEDVVKKLETPKFFPAGKLIVQKNVLTEKLYVRGQVNDYHLESLMEDTVFKENNTVTIIGKKNFKSAFQIHNLTLNIANQSEGGFLPQRLSKAKVVNIKKLYYQGYLDGVEANEFGRWLKSEGDQTVVGSQTIHSLEADNIEAGDFNSVNMSRLAFYSVFVTDHFTVDHAVFGNTVSAAKVMAGKEVNGLKLPEDLVLKDNLENHREHFISNKRLLGNLIIDGRFVPNSLLSFSNASEYCRLLDLPNTTITIQGNATFGEEPQIANAINKHKWTDLMNRVWFKDDNINISTLVVIQTQFDNLIVENINNANVSNSLSKLVSLSKDQEIEGELYFTNVTMKAGVNVVNASVGNHVQGLNLPTFICNVLLDGEEQQFTGRPDFVSILINGNLESRGLVNGLNLSSDVMLNNVESNEVESLTVENLTTAKMSLPANATVAGVDLFELQTLAARRSKPNTISGDITIKGMLDSSSGLRTNGLVNGLNFDKAHLMLKNENQNITGVKIFSPRSKLNITNLEVKRKLNNIFINKFYCDQLVTAEGDLTLTGLNQFAQPLHAVRAVLPEIYQENNLTRLETLLTFPLPWSQFHAQLAYIQANRTLIDNSIAGKPFYFKNIKHIGEITGNLPVLPLKKGNESVLASLGEESDNLLMSLLAFNNHQQTFHRIPGSDKHKLTHMPMEVQSVTLPNEDIVIYATTNQSSNSYEGGYGEVVGLNSTEFNTISTHKVFRGPPGNKLLSFQNKRGNTCFIVIAMNSFCDVSCYTTDMTQKKKWSSFSCENITEGVMVNSQSGGVYLVGLQTGYSNAVVLWQLQEKQVEFSLVLRMAVFNPVSLAAIVTERGPHIAVATRHLLGSSHPEYISFFRFEEGSHEMIQESTAPCVAPKKILFARLPSQEVILYVASDNPATPVEVLVYRGIQGYRSLTVLATLPVPRDISCFTDEQSRHFLLVHSSLNRTHVLQAQFYQ